MPARRRRYIVGPVTRRVSSHLYWSRPFHTSTSKAMLMAIQYLTKFALKGTPFRQLPRKHGASARPMN